MKDLLLILVVQIIMYILLVINFRAVAQANVLWSVITDVLVAGMGFLVIRKIAKSENSWFLFLGYTIGSAIGSALGIFASKFILLE